MKKCIVLCYFGEFPNYFQFWLDSCGWNPSWDFLVVSDHKDFKNEYRVPENVSDYYMSFDELRLRAQSKFDFKISLDKPYKWCDYKPFVGLCFEEELKSYDYYGFCDCDLIFGRLSELYPDELIEKYERFLIHGHLQLYRNNEKIRSLFKTRLKSGLSYRQVYSSKYHFAFDEVGPLSIYQICVENEVIQYTDNHSVGDIYRFGDKFSRIICDLNGWSATSWDGDIIELQYAVIKDRSVILVNDKGEKDEVSYIHLQKRKMEIEEGTSTKFPLYIKHNTFTNDIDHIRDVKPKYVLLRKREPRVRGKIFRVRRALSLLLHSRV